MSQSTNKWMIVIVERHALWTLWCVDFLQNAIKENREIEILDLSSFRLVRHKGNSLYLLTKIYRKNRIESILRRVAIRNKIKIITPSIFERLKFPKRDFHKQNLLTFLNGLDSQYFEEIGSRITTETQIEPRILKHSSRVFDRVVEVITRNITEKGITKVVVPGGRTLIPSAVIAATQELGTPCTVLEQITSQSTRYFEFPLDFRKDLRPLQQLIDDTWAKGGYLKNEVAQNYLENKLRGEQQGRNFSAKFDSTIEIAKPHNKKLAAIFVGSGFEMAPTEVEMKSTDLGSEQQKNILRTFTKIAQENGFSVVLRGHPSSAGLEKMYAAEDREWAEFCCQNEITHFSSTSKVDSYKLMKDSDINVVYASTAGIDSIILETNTLILANTDWTHLVPELCAFDEQSIRDRFKNFEHIVDVKRLYPYAFFMERGGIKISNVEYFPTEGTLYFEGQQIGAPRFRYLGKFFKR